MYKQYTLGFEVWTNPDRTISNLYQCMAAFYYWSEALDYKDYCHRLGVDCFIRTLNPDGESWRTEHRPLPLAQVESY